MADDESKLQAWRDAKVKDWEAGGKLKTKYPDRAALDAWMDQQCEKVGHA